MSAFSFLAIDFLCTDEYPTISSKRALTKGRMLAACGAATMLGLLYQAPAAAQTAPAPDNQVAVNEGTSPAAGAANSGALDDQSIVVTARRRSETLLEVPIAVSAVSSARLQQLNINSLQDLQKYTPGLYTQSTGSGRTDRSFDQVVIRGIADALLSTVSVFLDGAPVPTDVIQNLGNEVERVEILKGPQSAAFGRQTFAGAVNVVTKDPGNDFGGYVDANVGSYDLYDLRASIDIPLITDMGSLRIGGRVYSTNGQYANVGAPGTRLGDQKTDSVNATLVVKPVDGLKIKAFGSYLYDNDGPGAGVVASENPTNTFNCNAGAGAGVNNFYCGAVPKYPASQIGNNLVTPQFKSQIINNSLGVLDPIFKSYNDSSGLKRKEYVTTFAADYQIPDSSVMVSSLTSYSHDTFDINQDLDGRDTSAIPNTTVPLQAGFVGESFLNYPDEVLGYEKDISQEVRITSGSKQRFRWMIGGNYFKDYSRSYVAGMFPNIALEYVNGALNTTTDKSVFFSAAFDFTNQITLNAEGRYLDELLTVYNRTPQTVEAKQSFHKFAPRISLQYKPIRDLMAYATYSKGVNKGGFNLTVLGLTDNERAYLATQAAVTAVYKPATLDNYEIGLKGELWNGRITFAVAGYYGKWKNQAFSQTIAVPLDNDPTASQDVSVTENDADSTVRGGEIEGGFHPDKHVSVFYSAGYTKVTLDHAIACAQCETITGATELQQGASNPYAPRFTASFGGEYTNTLVEDYNRFIGADLTHRSKIFTSYDNISWIGQSNKINTRIGIRSKRIDAQIYVDNILNEYSYNGVNLSSSLLGGNSVLLALPTKRTAGARITYRF